MTVYKQKRGKTFQFDFHWRGRRYTGTTGQLTKDAAKRVEQKERERVREEAYGIAPFDRMRTPSFHSWADRHVDHVQRRGRVSRVDQIIENLRVLLLFFGRKPQRSIDLATIPHRWRAQTARRLAAAPYHDLRLADPILDPAWIERFEDWMTSEGLSGPRKNQLRSAASGLYRTALLPAYRKHTNVQTNPFLHIERDDVESRERVLSQAQLWAWVAAAAPHARVAMAIAAYAPKLRAGVILGLRWKEHFDPDLRRIVVQRHKARRKKRRPQVVLVPDDLRSILRAWRQTHPRSEYVITFRGEPVASLKTGLRAAIARANKTLPETEQMTYGVKAGVTFHTIRHTMATMLAEMGVPEKLREAVMDQTQDTIQGYTHMAPAHEKKPLAQLARRLKLVDAVVAGHVPGQGSDGIQKPSANLRTRHKRVAPI